MSRSRAGPDPMIRSASARHLRWSAAFRRLYRASPYQPRHRPQARAASPAESAVVPVIAVSVRLRRIFILGPPVRPLSVALHYRPGV